MDKISEIRDKLAETFSESKYEVVTKVHEYNNAADLVNGFVSGFDAAMELELPVKFMEWWINDSDNSKDGELEDLTPKELYDYWIKNIYK